MSRQRDKGLSGSLFYCNSNCSKDTLFRHRGRNKNINSKFLKEKCLGEISVVLSVSLCISTEDSPALPIKTCYLMSNKISSQWNYRRICTSLRKILHTPHSSSHSFYSDPALTKDKIMNQIYKSRGWEEFFILLSFLEEMTLSPAMTVWNHSTLITNMEMFWVGFFLTRVPCPVHNWYL
jgi:hypothetical protein